MAHTHEFDCAVCGSHFDSKHDLARHHEKAHQQSATGTGVPRARVDDEISEVRDRNPGQGFVDPRHDQSRKT